MTVPPDRPPSGARAFGGLRGTSVVLLLSTLAGLLGLAGALLVAPLAADRFGEAPSVAASRAALSTLETARGALADPDPAQTEETRRARASAALAQTAGALSVLADPWRDLSGTSVIAGVAGLALGLLLLGWWLRQRWAGPMAEAERLGWEHVHGRPLVELDEDLGARDARAIARLLNALIQRGQHAAELSLQNDRSAFGELARSIETLGEGDLSSTNSAATGNLEPLARAVEETRKQLSMRVREIHSEASALAEGSAGMAKATRRMAVAFAEQRDALVRISGAAQSAELELEGSVGRLEGGLEGLHVFSRELRRSVQQHRAELSVAARRLGELRAVLGELAAAETRLEAIEECLGLLDDFRRRPPESEGSDEGAKVLSTRAALALKRGREAVASLRQNLGRVRAETSHVASTLAETATGGPTSGAELEPALMGALQESGLLLLRIEERVVEALRALERTSAELAGGANEFSELAGRAQGSGPRLARAIAGLRLDGYLEAEVLERLAQLEADLVVAEEGGLSPMGQAALTSVVEAAQASRARMSRLVAQTEATLDIVRGV